MKAVQLVVLFAFSLVFSVSAVTNEWTKPTSGYWEEPHWSLEELPSTTQESVAFRNPGWKALAIGQNTTANYPASLVVNDLIIDGPTNSNNQLLLNWAGLDAPLVVRSNLMIGTNGSLASSYSALQAANLVLLGSASFSDSSIATLDLINLKSGAAFNLNDTYLTSSNLVFYSGTFTQTAGIALISNISTAFSPTPFSSSRTYYLSNGILVSENVSLGRYDLSLGGAPFAIFQSGGIHTNLLMSVSGGQRHFKEIMHLGRYSLDGGLLVSSQTLVDAGTMDQSGGTNFTAELIVNAGGYYTLNGGQLVTSNTTLQTVDCLHNAFVQNGGSHIVQNRLLLGNSVRYSLPAGTLNASTIELTPDAELQLLGGTLSNPGMVVLKLGTIRVEASPQQLGKLQVLDGTGYSCSSGSLTGATLYMGSTNVPTELRFQDSRDVDWPGTLQIQNWSTNHSGAGRDRIFFGSTSQGLTSNQLSRIIFIRPSGLSSDYTAAITATGELVPAVTHDYNYASTNGTITITGYTGPGGNISIPNTIANLPVTSIGNAAFQFATSLTSVRIPTTVTNISDNAFNHCSGLTNISIPEGVLRIGNFAFQDCANLTNLTIPASVSELGNRIFETCDNLLTIDVAPDNQFYSSLDGVLFDKNQTRLMRFPEHRVGDYVVPQTVVSLEDYAFHACYNLSNVVLSASVTNIGSWAFGFCTSLADIAINQNLKTIGDFAFFDCFSLTNVILPDTLASIGGRSFENCSALTRIEISRGITVFGGGNFAGCTKLTAVYFRGDAPISTSDFYYSPATIYYLPGTIGWGPTLAGRPTAPWFLEKPVVLDFGPGFGIRTNQFGFVISWATNALVIVEASTNLTDSAWSAISTNALANGSSYFSDVQWTNNGNRFYRLRTL